MSVTIKDIARAAGVSYSTVSKALRNSPLVKEPTRKHIKKIADQLGYQPNAAARSLVSKKSHTIGIVWPTIERAAHSSLITSMNNRLEQLSYTSLISINEMEFAINVFNRYRVDAVLVFDDGSNQGLSPSKVPVVSYGIAESSPFVPTVDVQRRKAIYLAAEYLHSIGHTKISYFGVMDTPDVMQREKAKGFDLAVEKFKLEAFPTLHVPVSSLESYEGYLAAKKLMQQEVKPTAIISSSHDLTKGILRAFQELNVSVPEDMSFISYDTIPEVNELEVPISTVGVPLEIITEKLTEALMDVVVEHDSKENIIYLEPGLSLRNSCKPFT
ncbi:LacI family DNA-binding transcriptional regulator [Jeotgalibacillus proteolyticus]|uniref:Transcriptional regulator n=1 Tax=Jeotgalibacillus proteolyticus TaxID=2082395 RepID=A0A2S5GAH7_9BACL|nr:LacI family DNA-binding transcriptional regulator [Jeotgalibacillus proteolyticus]PPA69925.1 transcriptional regulator [Jeotgalibacillus proteolyticus]